MSVVRANLALFLRLAMGIVVQHPVKYHFPGLPIVAQVSHLTVISIFLLPGSPLAMATKCLDHIILPPVVVRGIPVEILPTMASMDLAQLNVLAMVTKYLVHVSLLTPTMDLI